MKLIIGLLVLFSLCQGMEKLSKPPKDSGCPKGMHMFSDTGRCFYVSGNFDTYANAQKSCESMQSQLAPPLTCDEHVDLRDLLYPERRKCRKGQNCLEFWIGINNISGGNWKTTRGFEIEKKHQCQQWAKHFPRDNEGKCVVMSFIFNLKKGAWKNTNCNRTLKYVCIACPAGYDYVPEIDECLSLNLNPANWTEARKNCAKTRKNAGLMTIQDPIKQQAVEYYMNFKLANKATFVCYFPPWPHGGRIFWLGGQTEDPDNCNTSYVWKPVGTPPIPLTYTNWHLGNPNCGYKGENCIAIMAAWQKVFQWDDLRCQFSLCYVCEL